MSIYERDFELWEQEISYRPEMGISDQDRQLTEVDNLLNNRIGPCEYLQTDDMLQNFASAVQEQAMLYAVTTTEHDVISNPENRKERMFYWLGKSAVENAMSGYKFYRFEESRRRGDYEVDEARKSKTLTPGIARVFVSPKMTRKDASLEIAKEENLAAEDAVRVSWLDVNKEGKEVRKMQSMLVRNIPIEAWTSMLEDPNNIFGKSISVDDRESALSVMKVHGQLDLPVDKLPNGPVSILEAVAPYITDGPARESVEEQIAKFHNKDQEEMHREAQSKAQEWLEFDMELAESLVSNEATTKIKSFIHGLQNKWSGEVLDILEQHKRPNAGYLMSRKLAAVLDSAQQKMLIARAAVAVDPESVSEQVGDKKIVQVMRDNEILVQLAKVNGMDHHKLTMQQNMLMAQHNIKGPGGGCSGVSATDFGGDNGGLSGLVKKLFQDNNEDNPEDRSSWFNKRAQCRVEACKTRPGKTMVGPCSICKDCQDKFDAGDDPTLDKATVQAELEPIKAIGDYMLTGLSSEFTMAARG